MPNTFQNIEFTKPFNDLTKYIPSYLRNEMNVSLFDNLFNRFMTHDESVSMYGYVGEKPTMPDDMAPKVPQPTIERDVNAIIPVISFNVGAEKQTFTVQDLIRKAQMLDVANEGRGWLYSQSNNFVPPINLDKFVNFYRYYWAAKSMPVLPELAWNPTNAPEYYVSARPTLDDLNKSNVEVATTEAITLTGSGFNQMDFRVLFSETAGNLFFTIRALGDLGGWTPQEIGPTPLTSYDQPVEFVVTRGGMSKTLLTFNITREIIYNQDGQAVGYSSFADGDYFTIDATFLSRVYSVAFTGSFGVKGKLTKLRAISEYQTIDGIVVRPGDRVLVKDNVDAQNGIFIASAGEWLRANDFSNGYIVSGAKVWVKSGNTNKDKLFKSTVYGGGNVTWQFDPTAVDSNTSDWQEGNFWYTASELDALGISRDGVVQASRPIIEYDNELELNIFVSPTSPETPSNSGYYFRQTKERFNQMPMFNLYRYDGTHSGLVSPIFYYEEDRTSKLDTALQQRPKDTENSSDDFLFNHGMFDEATGQLLFARNTATRKPVSIWHAGYLEATLDAITFDGEADGAITDLEIVNPETYQQIWTLSAISDTEFQVEGSMSGLYPNATIGVPYSNGEISFTLVAGAIPFSEGEQFFIRVGNLERPAYVTPDQETYRATNPENEDGAWKISRGFYNNPFSESRAPITEGVISAHLDSILSAQKEGMPTNLAFGGSIKLWGEQLTLFASLLMQRDMTPLSIVAYAEKMYEQSLTNIIDIYQQNIASYLGSVGSIKTQEGIDALLDNLLDINAKGELGSRVLFDTSSPVKGFPITLPQMSCSELFQPLVEYSPELGIMVMRHHDGHFSDLVEETVDFKTVVLGQSRDVLVKRSDGTVTPAVGSFTNTPPVNPYKGELWAKLDGSIFSFAVNGDEASSPEPFEGALWWNRTEVQLYEYTNGAWIISSRDPWQTVNFASIQNRLILALETRLFESINPNTRQIDFTQLESDPAFQARIKSELYSFATLNNYDVATTGFKNEDAFTWNYSSVAIGASAPIADAVVPARWFDYLQSHQRTISGVIPTPSPHLEPWKLFGFNDANAWWWSLNPTQQAAYTPAFQPDQLSSMTSAGVVVAVSKTVGSPTLSGLLTVDGIELKTGNQVLVIAESNPSINGIWVAGIGAWQRSNVSLSANSYVAVQQGAEYRGTVWGVVSNNGADIVFGAVRRWTAQMWRDIKTAHPSLKLSVNIFTDALLPPYVSANSFHSLEALTKVMPSSIDKPYVYGQNAPIELAWKMSINYKYARVRALIKHDPLLFLGFAWGFNWVNVDGISYDGFDVSMPGAKRFYLHGESVNLVRERQGLIASGSGQKISLTYSAYDSDRRQNFTVKNEAGVVIGYAQEGVPASFGGWFFTIEDNGIPYRIGDTFELSVDSSTFTPIVFHKINGFAQIFTDAMRGSSIDTGDSYAISAYRGWDLNMGYRAGGLVSSDDLQVSTELETLSSSAYSLVFKRNPAAGNTWLQALRITPAKFGASYTNANTGVNTPAGDGSDWVFKIEGYNPRYNIIKAYQMNPVDDLVTFYALDKANTDIVWTQPTDKLFVQPETIQLPITITGIQNVVNFLYGYALKLDEDGWRFNQGTENLVDAQTGRTRTMQLEIEKYINACFVGLVEGNGHIINPFMDFAWLKQETGLLAEFNDTPLFDVIGHAGAFDVLGVKYNRDDLSVIRRNDQSMIGAAGPIYSLHALIDEYEHLFIFNDYVNGSTDAGLLYDPFSGSRTYTYKFNGRRQYSKTMRPEFGGHYLVGDKVFKNLQASTDSVQLFYDANTAFENEKTAKQALGLLGFNEKKYFNDLDISNNSQFNFWRGLVQYKGTNMSVGAYLNNNRFDDAKIDEFWAYKVAEYGDSRQREFPEMRLKVSDVLTQFAQYEFDSPVVCNGDDCKLDVIPGFINVDSADEDRWFTIEDLNSTAKFDAELVGTYRAYHFVGDIIHLDFVADGLRNADRDTVTSYDIINATTIRVTDILNGVNVTVDGVTRRSGTFIVHGYGAPRPRYNPVKLFNYQLNELIREIPIWHPAAGTYTPQALESVNIISGFNPARFNYSTIVESNYTYDPLRVWGKNEVGRTWLDTTDLSFVPYYDKYIFPDIGERLSRWGMLSDFGSVNVYEWVQSSVPPSEYNALARTQAGDANLDPLTKAAGEVGFPITYKRDRSWTMYPIAWSFSPVPLNIDWEGIPPFAAAANTVGLLFDGGLAILDGNTFKSLGITPGMHIGAWFDDDVEMYPMSEYEITTVFTKFVCDEDGTAINTLPAFVSSDQGFTANVTIGANDAFYNPDIAGQILFTKPQIEAYATTADQDGRVISYNIDIPLKATIIGSGVTEQIIVTSAIASDPNIDTSLPSYGAVINVAEDQAWAFTLPRLGLNITVQAVNDGTFPAEVVRNIVANALLNLVYLRDAAIVNPIIASQVDATSLSNDVSDYAAQVQYGWKAWNIPTQAQLDADSMQPVSSWKPFIGPAVGIAGNNAQIIAAVEYAKSPLTLNDGTVIQRYNSVWSGWNVLSDITVNQTQLEAVGPIEFIFDDLLPITRTSVYVNGSLQLKSAYSIINKTVTVHSVKPGAVATVVVRKYDPTPAELLEDAEFDLTRQVQYKLDYEYVEQAIRGEDGGIAGYEYFFWVKNKSTTAIGKKMSTQNITKELVNGPDSYLTFQNYQLDGSNSPFYNAITVSGLTSVVTKDDTFKLRFTRDFTLRDDPQELDLKNVHTEWTLIRPNQRVVIPEALWWKLTDSVVGFDVAGNNVPSLRRVLYDERNNARTQFGFGSEQTLAPSELLKVSITHSIVNTNLVVTGGTVIVPDHIEGLNYDDPDSWFDSAASSRNTMTEIWNSGSPEQINEIFFAVLDDILASNYELTDLFKTSRLSAHSIKVVRPAAT